MGCKRGRIGLGAEVIFHAPSVLVFGEEIAPGKSRAAPRQGEMRSVCKRGPLSTCISYLSILKTVSHVCPSLRDRKRQDFLFIQSSPMRPLRIKSGHSVVIIYNKRVRFAVTIKNDSNRQLKRVEIFKRKCLPSIKR